MMPRGILGQKVPLSGASVASFVLNRVACYCHLLELKSAGRNLGDEIAGRP